MERPEFWQLCFLLRPDLHDADIPHRTTMHKRIIDNFEETLYKLSQHIQVISHYCILLQGLTVMQKSSAGKVSFTTDLWSDPDSKSYIAVTAHWLEVVQTPGGDKRLTLRADLIGFLYFPGNHTGERLAKIFYLLLLGWGFRKGNVYFISKV